MKSSIIIGKIKGIEIELHFSWLLIFGLLTYTMATNYFIVEYPEINTNLAWFLSALIPILMLISILLHELSHSMVSIALNIKVDRITLFIFGGLAKIEKEPEEPKKELKIALAGPAMSLALFVVFNLISLMMQRFDLEEYLIFPFTFVSILNLYLAIFNMIPAFPLDGGRVLRAVIWLVKKDLKLATKITSTMGEVFGYTLIFFGLFGIFLGNLINGLWFAFIGWYIKQLSEVSYQNMLMDNVLKIIPVSEFMTKDVVIVDFDVSIMRFIDDFVYRYKYRCYPVARNEEIVGIVSLESVRKIPQDEWRDTAVNYILTPIGDQYKVKPTDVMTNVMKKLYTNSLGRVLVMEEAQVIGIISRTDVLNYIHIYNKLHEK